MNYPRRQQFRRLTHAAEAATASSAAALLGAPHCWRRRPNRRYGATAVGSWSRALRPPLAVAREAQRCGCSLGDRGAALAHGARGGGVAAAALAAVARPGGHRLPGNRADPNRVRHRDQDEELDYRHLARVHEQAVWLSRRRRRWCRRGALPVLCLVRARGVERVEQNVLVVSIDRLLPVLRRSVRRPGPPPTSLAGGGLFDRRGLFGGGVHRQPRSRNGPGRVPCRPRIARQSALEQRWLSANERRARPEVVTMVRRPLLQAYIRQRGRAGSRSARCCVPASPIRFSQGETIGIKRGGLQRCLERDGIPDHHDIGCRPRRRRGTRPNEWRYQMAELPPPRKGIVLTYFIVSDDVERSRRFYSEVLGGRVVFSGEGGPTNVALSNGWIVINGGAVDRRTTSRRSPWRRHAIPTGSAASSISGSKTSRPCTPNGAPGVRIS